MDIFDIDKEYNKIKGKTDTEYNKVKNKLDKNLNEVNKDKNKFLDFFKTNKKYIVLTIIPTISCFILLTILVV